ncbi:MAG TPA: ABC transporter permease subunit [Actinomycetota bacterium]|nr:ABC transporter permease subunit [Actinomycetota bacterium]
MSRARWLAREIVPPLVGIAGVVAIWALVAATTSSSAIPSPAVVWSAFLAGMRDGSLPEAALKTLIRLAFSFVVAVALGVVLGIVLALNGLARRAIRPLIVALQITPFVAWVPLAVIWFGATERAVVFVAIVGSFPAMTLATLQAVRQVPPLWERTGRTLGARGWTLYRKVVFPAALPGVMAGLQQAWGFAWKALMAGEVIVAAAHAGLGHLIARPGTTVPTLLAALGVILVIGVAVDYLLFGQLDRRIRRRRGLLIET